MKKDEQYIKEKFSNKKTLFKGEAIVLLKLARQVGKEKCQKIIGDRILKLKLTCRNLGVTELGFEAYEYSLEECSAIISNLEKLKKEFSK